MDYNFVENLRNTPPLKTVESGWLVALNQNMAAANSWRSNEGSTHPARSLITKESCFDLQTLELEGKRNACCQDLLSLMAEEVNPSPADSGTGGHRMSVMVLDC